MTAVMAAIDDQSNVQLYAGILWRRRLVVLMSMVVLLAVTLAYCFAVEPVYEGSAKLLLAPPLPSTVLQANNSFSAQVTIDVPTNIQIIESQAVRQIARQSVSPIPAVTATQIGQTNVVTVTADSTNASVAARAANAYANAYIEFEHKQVADALQAASKELQQRLQSVQQAITSVSQEVLQGAANPGLAGIQSELGSVQSSLESEQTTLEQQLANYDSFLNLQSQESGFVLTPAVVPGSPAKPKTAEYAVFAALIGLVVGIALALVMESFGTDSLRRDPSHPAGTAAPNVNGGDPNKPARAASAAGLPSTSPGSTN